MRKTLISLVAAVGLSIPLVGCGDSTTEPQPAGRAGNAGTIVPADPAAAADAQYRAMLDQACAQGWEVKDVDPGFLQRNPEWKCQRTAGYAGK